MLQNLRDILTKHYSGLLKKEPEVLNKLLESPKQAGHGHLAMPVFAWAKEARKAPPILAQEIASQLAADKPAGLQSITPVSGFVNFTFDDKFVQDLLIRETLQKSGRIGHSTFGAE